MLLTFYLLFIGLHVFEGCIIVGNGGPLQTITAQTGGLTLKEGPPTTTPSRTVVNVHTRPTTSSQKPDEDQSGTSQSTAVDNVHSSSITSITPTTQAPNNYSMHFSIFIPVLLLLLGLGGFIYWRYRGRKQGQTESREERRTKTGQEMQDEVTYSTVVHSKTTTTTTTVIDTGEKAEYATIKVN
ncbi:hypothetical protein MHYP_G00050470 [Metynnis hypsauchen]